MARKDKTDLSPRTSISATEAEELFAKVDNSGHANEDSAQKQRERRKLKGHGVEVDPLSSDDPSGSNVGTLIQKAAVVLVILFLGGIVFIQFYVSHVRSANTANLSNNVTVGTVADALKGGVEWGGGFTQFPPSFSVQEADENTGRIEVSVVDTTSRNDLVCFSSSQIQATAFSVNSLLNPDIDTVIYHVNVHMSEDGQMQRNSLFGYFKPTGDIKPFITFIWTKTTTSDGEVRFNCTITGLDANLQHLLRDQIMAQVPEVKTDDPRETTYTQYRR
ncbi:MAG: hypothetical protein Q4A01_05930 [Coriobacteriales bacterium]|nr:hypothetical protein [Coriobacteriales bacterium]